MRAATHNPPPPYSQYAELQEKGAVGSREQDAVRWFWREDICCEEADPVNTAGDRVSDRRTKPVKL